MSTTTTPQTSPSTPITGPHPARSLPTDPGPVVALWRSARSDSQRWTSRRAAAGLAISVLLGAGLSAILTSTLGGSANPTSLTAADLTRADGAWRPVMSAMTYGAIPIFCLAVALAAGDQQHGTWRTALLHQPRRGALVLGQLLSRWTVFTLFCLAAVVAGSLTTAMLAPGAGIDTTSWTVGGASGPALGAGLRLVGYIGGWTILGTALGLMTRSVPIALGAGLLWSGPVENILGDELSFAAAWFPGILLRGLLEPELTTVDPTRVAVVVAGYGLLALLLLLRSARHHDVTR